MTKSTTSKTVPGKRKKQSGPLQEVWKRLKKNKLALVCMAIIAILLLIVIFADVIVPYENAITQVGALKMAPPSAEHIFGGDGLGRDLFARVIHGSRVSLFLGFGATTITTIIATLLGSVVAYVGGKADAIVMRILDIIISIPTILLALAIAAGFGIGIPQVLISVSLAQVASFTRVVRAAVLNIVDLEYIEASRAIGLSDFSIVMQHIIPNVIGIILVQFTMQVAENVLMCATLSFLGLGARIPTPEWGKIMAEGLPFLRYSVHIVIFPIIFITTTALSINLLGDALRDAFDPRLKGRA